MRVLVVNTGSSSLKLSVLDADGSTAASRTIQPWEGEKDLDPLTAFLAECGPVDAVGHRVVHGGPEHTGPARVDGTLIAALAAISHLAPLHNPRAIAALIAVGGLLPDAPAVACFDTSFHATLPPAARTYAVPREWTRKWGLRRYGFHGLSHAYASRRGAELIGRSATELRIVSCHLGAGASLAAVRDGVSVDTTMGFTPLAGLVMNTRPGTLDPGLILWLQQHGHVPVGELAEVLDHRSGLAGLSGTSGDMREVLAGRERGDGDCGLAFDVYVHRLAREIAAMTAATDGLDLLVMTGGVGEYSAPVREAVVATLPHLGAAIDPELNRTTTSDGEISAPGATARTVVVTAREDLEIRRQVMDLLS